MTQENLQIIGFLSKVPTKCSAYCHQSFSLLWILSVTTEVWNFQTKTSRTYNSFKDREYWNPILFLVDSNFCNWSFWNKDKAFSRSFLKLLHKMVTDSVFWWLISPCLSVDENDYSSSSRKLTSTFSLVLTKRHWIVKIGFQDSMKDFLGSESYKPKQ